MSRKLKVNFRLPPETIQALDHLAEAAGVGTSEVVRRLLPSPGWIQAIKDIAAAENTDVLSVVFVYAAEAMKLRMHEGGPEDKAVPIDMAFLWPIAGDAEAIAKKYAAYCDAKTHAKKNHFAKPPKGGYWEEQGITGYDVLPKKRSFTRDGVRDSLRAESTEQ